MLKDTLLDIVVTALAGTLCAFAALTLVNSAGIVPILDLWHLPELICAHPLTAMLLALCIPFWGRIAVTFADLIAHH